MLSVASTVVIGGVVDTASGQKRGRQFARHQHRVTDKQTTEQLCDVEDRVQQRRTDLPGTRNHVSYVLAADRWNHIA